MNNIIYLDAAASSLKPDSVIEAELNFLRNNYANAGRGICQRATNVDNMLLEARNAVADFINADAAQVVFTSGTTDGMNRIVSLLSNKNIKTVAVSDLDHHSARMPWEQFCKDNKAELKVCELNDNLDIDISSIPYADVLIITAMSNVMGNKQNVSDIILKARQINPSVITVVDAAQYVVHDDIDVKKWNCDFLCFSAHKIGADTGLGIMYIKNPELFYPDKLGGGMVNHINGFADWVLNDYPDKFEAGTLPLTAISGLKNAIENLKNNRPNLKLIGFLYDELKDFDKIKILSYKNSCLFSFIPKNMHVLDFGALIGASNICLRVGNMCASWIHKHLNVSGSVRISVGFWNTQDEIKYVVDLIKKILK